MATEFRVPLAEYCHLQDAAEKHVSELTSSTLNKYKPMSKGNRKTIVFLCVYVYAHVCVCAFFSQWYAFSLMMMVCVCVCVTHVYMCEFMLLSEVYGEVLPPLVEELMKNLNMTADDVFVDIGSGIGNVVGFPPVPCVLVLSGCLLVTVCVLHVILCVCMCMYMHVSVCESE
jgi:Histone methylation protein DOT1